VKGVVVDRIPFSVVELLLWSGGLATLLFVISWFLPRSARRRLSPRDGRAVGRFRAVLFLLGPVLLLLLALGQGALPVAFGPAAWRAPLSRTLGADSVSEEAFRSWVEARDRRLSDEFDWWAYRSLSDEEALRVCDRGLDSVLVDLGLPPGRTVRVVKLFGPLTTIFALAYGGPGYHDPLTGELGLPRPQDYPSARSWRLIAICHELAHAKGFTREVDAEILTQLALLRVRDPRFRTLADIHFLEKSGIRVEWPDSLAAESRRVWEESREVERRQRTIAFLKRLAERARMRNSAAKYGTRTREQAWNPRQPFFATVHRLEPRFGR
jgi:hypothetical protein